MLNGIPYGDARSNHERKLRFCVLVKQYQDYPVNLFGEVEIGILGGAAICEQSTLV